MLGTSDDGLDSDVDVDVEVDRSEVGERLPRDAAVPDAAWVQRRVIIFDRSMGDACVDVAPMPPPFLHTLQRGRHHVEQILEGDGIGVRVDVEAVVMSENDHVHVGVRREKEHVP